MAKQQKRSKFSGGKPKVKTSRAKSGSPRKPAPTPSAKGRSAAKKSVAKAGKVREPKHAPVKAKAVAVQPAKSPGREPVTRPSVTRPAVKPAPGNLVKAPAAVSASVPSRAPEPPLVRRPVVAQHDTAPESRKLTPAQIQSQRRLLLEKREQLTGQVSALKHASLAPADPIDLAEDGTDSFQREFTLGLMASENQSVYEIDEALGRMHAGVYGLCESCGCNVEFPRLKALPAVRLCVRCQAAQEKNGSRPRFL